MTIDERIEFLVQSTESLHQTVANQEDRLAKAEQLITRLVQNNEKLSVLTEKNEVTMGNLLGIVTELVSVIKSHEDRIKKLEG